MGRVIVYVIEVNRSAELVVCRSGEEIQASVSSKDCAGLSDNRGNRRVAKYVIITLAAGNLHQLCHRIIVVSCIYKMKFYSVFCSFLRREQVSSTIEALLIQISNNNH